MDDGNNVFEARIRRVQEEMARRDVDFLFVTPSSDLIYLLGYAAHASERLTLLGIPRDGTPFIVAPQLEAMRLNERGDMLDIHVWGETESPIALVGRLVEGGQGASIAVNDQTWSGFLIGLQGEIDAGAWQSATGILRELRMVKDAAEIEHLRTASRASDEAWQEFVETTSFAGRTELDVGRDLNRLQVARGLETSFLITASGPNSASPHYITGERVIREGEPVLFDFGGRWHHYTSDITRMVHVGEPSDEYREIYEIVLRANRAVLDGVRPGMACQDVDKLARDVIAAAGYGERFIHRVGHGLGLDTHEEPYMVGGNETPLRPGMTFSDEPGIYLEGQFGVRIEDLLAVTDTGAESLNNAARDIVIVK
jgi:Xaa-Pro aminopeptidase